MRRDVSLSSSRLGHADRFAGEHHVLTRHAALLHVAREHRDVAVLHQRPLRETQGVAQLHHSLFVPPFDLDELPEVREFLDVDAAVVQLPRLPALVRLYDELILRAEGYCANGHPSSSLGVNSLREFMDAWHKRVAVQTLFGEMAPESPQPAHATEDTR